MSILETNREFIDSLLEYYVGEAKSYKQIAENFTTTESIDDTAFGIIIGCIYSGFLQACQNQKESPGLEDMKEFYSILNNKAPIIKKALQSDT